MKITDKILSLPPYVSTSWKNIVSLRVESRAFGHALLIELLTGSKIEVPNLDIKMIEKIFSMHAHVVEEEGNLKKMSTQSLGFSIPIIDGIPSVLQHNPEQANSPPLPAEVLEKIAAMTQGIIPTDGSILPQPEPHCNCPHCQIIRAVLGPEPADTVPEENISDEDLKFRSWDIRQEGEKLYCVTNPLDIKEHYNVFLGEPLGCTCGSKNCEHIQAVLRS